MSAALVQTCSLSSQPPTHKTHTSSLQPMCGDVFRIVHSNRWDTVGPLKGKKHFSSSPVRHMKAGCPPMVYDAWPLGALLRASCSTCSSAARRAAHAARAAGASPIGIRRRLRRASNARRPWDVRGLPTLPLCSNPH